MAGQGWGRVELGCIYIFVRTVHVYIYSTLTVIAMHIEHFRLDARVSWYINADGGI